MRFFRVGGWQATTFSHKIAIPNILHIIIARIQGTREVYELVVSVQKMMIFLGVLKILMAQ